MAIERSIDTEEIAEIAKQVTDQTHEPHRLVDSSTNPDDSSEQDEEVTLRPLTFADYIGQERLKTNLKLAIDAIKNVMTAPHWIMFCFTVLQD